MRRREFIAIIGAAAAVWPLAASAQQGDRMRRIGVLLPYATNEDPLLKGRLAAFMKELQRLGWIDSRNALIDVRLAGNKADDIPKAAAELVALGPDVIMTVGSATVGPLRQLTRTVPIVFAFVPDPVGAGLIESLARPGGNATGFTSFEYGISAKWLELLKEMAPGMKRVAVLGDPALAVGAGQYGAIQSAAPSFGVELRPVNIRDPAEIERGIAAFAASSDGGIIVTGSPFAPTHRELIVTLATRHKLPAIYYERFFATNGGLMSYGADSIDQFRQAAGYVDRVFKGEKPADLPVQAPTKNELVINLKAAKTIGLTVPPTLIARADEVIE